MASSKSETGLETAPSNETEDTELSNTTHNMNTITVAQHEDQEQSSPHSNLEQIEPQGSSLHSIEEQAQPHKVMGSESQTNQSKPSSDIESTEVKPQSVKKIELGAEFGSFLDLRDALERYQIENSVQLIVKDSKLLSAEATRRIIPKVHHLVNKDLMYHSITYYCKCHGETTSRMKKVGRRRSNCPMYMRFRLSPDLQKLFIFDIQEKHNHGIDPTTCQLPPRQQVYTLSRFRHRKLASASEQKQDDAQNQSLRPKKRTLDSATKETNMERKDFGSLISSAIEEVNSESTYLPPPKTLRPHLPVHPTEQEEDHRPASPVDSESSFTDDSDEEERRIQRRLLPFPIRLIGSAVRSCPELIEATKQLIALEKAKVVVQKEKLKLEMKRLELGNLKLEMEVKKLEASLASDMAGTGQGQDTTIFLHA